MAGAEGLTAVAELVERSLAGSGPAAGRGRSRGAWLDRD
jgi:hypothetical protein